MDLCSMGNAQNDIGEIKMDQSNRELMRRSLSFLNYLDFMVTRVSEHISMPYISWMVRKVKYVYSPHEGIVMWGEWNGYLMMNQEGMELYPFIDKMAAEMPDIEDGWDWSGIFEEISNQGNKHVVNVMDELQRWYVGQGLAVLSGLYHFSNPLKKEEEDNESTHEI
jgi:hypothetical protein